MGVPVSLARMALRSLIVLAAIVGSVTVPSQVQEYLESPGSPLQSSRTTGCPIETPDGVEVDCGELTVPENHDDTQGRQIRLPYMILRSPSPDPEPDPVIFTAGGPGFSSLSSVWLFAESRLLDHRDIIIFEQRGNRYANPALTCDVSVWWEETADHTPCLDRIQAAGIDITRYTTDDIVRDVIALRDELGYEQWNLYGWSFSTSVMLLVMEADPDGTRSAILQSVKPPSETTFAHEADSPLRAIEQMFSDCGADEPCADSYPDLADDFFALVRRLNDEPIELEITSTAEADPIPIALDGHRFVDWVAINQLYQPIFPPHDPAYLPLLIDEAHRGNARPLEIAAENFWAANIENPDWAFGLMFAINCQQDMPAAGPTRPPADLAASDQLEGFARSSSQRDICQAWDLAPLAPAATEYVRSELPVLVLAGSYDPVTPPDWGRTTADHLRNSTYVEFAGRGHDVTTGNACAATLEAAFVADPTRALDTSCVETAPGPTFVLRDDVYHAPGLARSGDEVSLGESGGVAWIEAIAALGIYGSIVTALLLILAALIWLVRIRRQTTTVDRTAVIAYTLTWLATLAALTLGFLIDQVNEDYTSRGALAFSLGPSRDLTSARLLAWISPPAGIAIVALTVASVWAWLSGRWSIGFRTLMTIGALCSLAMALLGLRWDVFTMLL